MKKAEIEEITRVVYGETFERYTKEEFLEFMRPLEIRLRANGIPLSSFEGKKCIDAGCGGGRGTVLMARAGAKEVVSYDLAARNTDTTARIAGLFGLGNVRTECGSLLEIPYPDETFDVVWCNGVIHHTKNPDLALREIMRILRVGGHMWLYAYGSGGIYWFLIDSLRDWLKDVDIRLAILTLDLMGTPTGKIAEFIDDWYVPVLRRYTNNDIVNRLREFGAENPRYLKSGMAYDTSQRRGEASENIWMGEGDLRYWITKTSPPAEKNEYALPNIDEKGSAYKDSDEVLSFSRDFDELISQVQKLEAAFPELGWTARIAAAARLQTRIREMLNTPQPFDAGAFRSFTHSQASGILSYIKE